MFQRVFLLGQLTCVLFNLGVFAWEASRGNVGMAVVNFTAASSCGFAAWLDWVGI